MENLYQTIRSRHSITSKLVVLFLAMSVLPLMVVAGLVYNQARLILTDEVATKLTGIRSNKVILVERHFENIFAKLEIFAQSQDVLQFFNRLSTYQKTKHLANEDSFDVNDPAYRQLYSRFGEKINYFRQDNGFEDIYLIDANSGQVLFSAARKADFGANLLHGPYRDTNLARMWEQVTETKALSIVDFEAYEPNEGQPAAFAGYPVFDEQGVLLGVFAVQLSTTEINNVMQNTSGLGETGETYLVGPDMLMRSNSRFFDDSTILTKQVDSATVKRALTGQSGVEPVTDYRGIPVLSAYEPVDVQGLRWVLLAEIDKTEAYAPLQQLLSTFLIFLVIGVVVVGGLSYLISLSITRPLKEAINLTQEISGGNLNVTLQDTGRKDELGVLYRVLSDMIIGLRQQIEQITEGVNVLVASVSQISATTTQLTASAAETATSISETTATIEEVRQTAELSTEKAGQLSTEANKASHSGLEGKAAVEKISAGMSHIGNQMEAIADSIIKLSEQSQDIGEIIATVDDIAEQSNLLAVNAAIEAAKAGEQGKGFSVVAQEIRSLAEQSKRATTQVRNILYDIQKATGTAVMSTEQGTKAVEAGLVQSTEAGQAITTLAEKIAQAAQTAVQIAASSQEQLVGVDQVTGAMENINLAGAQNVESAKQLDGAAKNLEALGAQLKQTISRYQL